MAATNLVFPVGAGQPLGDTLAWDWDRAPEWKTLVHESVGGNEQRATFYTYPRWRWGLRWEVVPDDRATVANATPTALQSALRTIFGFFNARRGKLDSFLLDDPSDREVTDQTVIASSGSGVTDYQLPRAYGGFLEPVCRINAVAALKVNGVTQGGGTYTVNSPAEGWVRFNAAPSAGSTITWSGTYYWRVRFTMDTAKAAQFMYDLWNLRQLELLSVRL